MLYTTDSQNLNCVIYDFFKRFLSLVTVSLFAAWGESGNELLKDLVLDWFFCSICL